MSAIEIEKLHRAIERYLSAVEVFRQEGREPSWAPEVAGPPRVPVIGARVS
jgi:hypothetical protein